MRPPSAVRRKIPKRRFGLVPIARINWPVYWWLSSSDVGVTRAKSRSPCPKAGSPLRLRMSILGKWPVPSHSSGTANMSPCESGPSICNTETGGKLLGSLNRRRRCMICPSASNSFSICLRSMRAAPFMPKALAISRFEDFSGCARIHSRISACEGI